MPTRQDVLDALTATANGWWPLAVGWHFVLAVCLTALAFGWRPSRRVAAILMLVPVASVAAFAVAGRDVLDAVVFLVLGVALAATIQRAPPRPVRAGRRPMRALGAVLIAFAWVYPYYLDAPSSDAYLYAAPMGLIPASTIALITGLTMLVHGLITRSWSLVVAFAALFYGVLGVVVLRVGLDAVLIVGGLALVMGAPQPIGRRPPEPPRALTHPPAPAGA